MDDAKLSGAVGLLVLNLAAIGLAYWLLNGYVAGGLAVVALLNVANVRRVAREQRSARESQRPELQRFATDLGQLLEQRRSALGEGVDRDGERHGDDRAALGL